METMKQMKKGLAVVSASLVLFFLIGAVLPTATFSQGQPLKWRMPTLYPRGTAYTAVYHGFCENVKRMSNGRLEIEDIYDGEGISAMEILHAVSSGLAQMGAPYMALHAGELPAGIIELGLPGGPSSMFELRTLFQEGGFKEELRKAFAKHNFYWLSDYSSGGTYLCTKKPLNSLADLAKLKIRCPGAYGKMIRNLGASPVTIAFSEVYTALATGVVDGVDGCNIIDHRDGKFYEVAKYMYPLPLTGSQSMSLIVNMDAWNKLPDDLKAILETAGLWMGDEWAMKSFIWEKEALQEMKSKGLKMSPTPSAADVAKWKEAGRKVWPEYAALDPYNKELLRIQEEFMKKLGL
jgi:TRAP-type C4-dicarboxylate transport system substrate-binding protein